VTIVTPEAFVGKEIARTAADGPARRRMAKLGVKMLTEHCVTRWHGNGVTLRNLLTGEEETIPTSGLVMSTTNRAPMPSMRGANSPWPCNLERAGGREIHALLRRGMVQ
jgi:NADH dehydrogenase FAD-containing subunit